jgi:acetyl esterase/lipase
VLLTLLSAPLCYGKSTLLSQCAANLDSPWAWLRCTQDNNQPLSLLLHLAKALRLPLDEVPLRIGDAPGLRAAFVEHAEGRWWAGTQDPKTPLVSPLHGDFHGIAPIQVYIGTHDLFLPDSRRLNERVKAAGGTIEQHKTLGGFHAFLGVTFTLNAKKVYREIAEALAKP